MDAVRLTIGDGTRIEHYNFIRGVKHLVIGRDCDIGNLVTKSFAPGEGRLLIAGNPATLRKDYGSETGQCVSASYPKGFQ